MRRFSYRLSFWHQLGFNFRWRNHRFPNPVYISLHHISFDFELPRYELFVGSRLIVVCGNYYKFVALTLFSEICNWLVDIYIDLEDIDEEEEESDLEIGCTYCWEGFDALDLCVHLEDQHPIKIRLGVNYYTLILVYIILQFHIAAEFWADVL